MTLKPEIAEFIAAAPSPFPEGALTDPVESARYLARVRMPRQRPEPESVARVETVQVGDASVRVYSSGDSQSAPTIVFLHGGGWVLGDLEMHDRTCRMIANRTGAVVVNVGYRLAPEHPYPAALEDCAAALAWVAGSINEFGGSSDRLVLAGASAGGNLAVATALSAPERGLPQIVLLALVYPVIDSAMASASHRDFARGYVLEHEQMKWYLQQYVPAVERRMDPLVSPAQASSLRALPPTLIVTAEYDPLRDEAEEFGARLEREGVHAEVTRYPGQVHGFMNLFDVTPDAERALDALCSDILRNLNEPALREGPK